MQPGGDELRPRRVLRRRPDLCLGQCALALCGAADLGCRGQPRRRSQHAHRASHAARCARVRSRRRRARFCADVGRASGQFALHRTGVGRVGVGAQEPRCVRARSEQKKKVSYENQEQ